MSANEGKLRGDGPIALAGVQVGVANTADVELDETLAGGEVLGLLDGEVVDDLEGGGCRLDNRGLLGLGDGELGHDEGCGSVVESR